MATDTPTTFTEDGARKLIEEYLRTTGQPRNDFHRRRRHVNLGGSGGSDVIIFRLEEELQVGNAADARIVAPDTLLTQQGPLILVQDDEFKWFGRGSVAPSGDTGGDVAGNSNLGLALRTGAIEEGTDRAVYSVISCGTWCRYVEGHLTADSWVVTSDVAGWDGSWVRGDDGSVAGTVTLAGICVDPVAGMYFVAIFNETNRSYKIITLCCES